MFTIIQLYPRNPRSTSFAMSENVSKICSTQISTTKHQNAFDDILRQNGYPDNSIDQTKRPLEPSQRLSTYQHRMGIPQASVRLIFFEKRTSQYVMYVPTDHTPSDELSPTTPRSAHAPGTSAPFPTPNYVYEQTPSTKSRVRTASNSTSIALHASFTIVSENTSITKILP